MIEFDYEKEVVTQFTIAMPRVLEQYALTFLQMFNNAREYPNMILNIENNSGNSVFITCRTKDKESVREWIEAFDNTEVTYEEEIDRFTISATYDKKGWEVFWGSDNEVQFAVDIE